MTFLFGLKATMIDCYKVASFCLGLLNVQVIDLIVPRGWSLIFQFQ